MPQTFIVQHKVRLTSKQNELKENTFFINTDEILSNDNKVSQKAINFIFKALNGKEERFVRLNETPKAFYQDDFEGAYLRHTDFNRSPNISENEILKYDSIVKSEAKRAFNKFNKLSYQAGFEYNDLCNMGLVYLVSFMHKHDQSNEIDTRKLFRIYLRQRFCHWAETCYRKHKNAMSNNMYVSEEHHTNFRNELKLQHEVLSDANSSANMPEYANQDFDILYEGKKAKLCMRAKLNQPKYWINNKEFTQTDLSELICKGDIKGI